MRFPLLILSGPVGVGNELSEILRIHNIARTFVDRDTLAQTFHRSKDDPYGTQLALQNLQDLWTNAKAAGTKNLIVARVVETGGGKEVFRRSFPDGLITICQLTAQIQILLDRVRRRESGSQRKWHEKRALELANTLPGKAPSNFTVATDERALVDIANDIAIRMTWT